MCDTEIADADKIINESVKTFFSDKLNPINIKYECFLSDAN